MFGGYRVIGEELSHAASSVRDAVSPAECWAMSSGGASASSFGHDQLAEVYPKFCSKLTNVVNATAEGDQKLADQLHSTARAYENTDAQQAAGYALFGREPDGSPTSAGPL